MSASRRAGLRLGSSTAVVNDRACAGRLMSTGFWHWNAFASGEFGVVLC
jgi:hypothetical protein